MDPTATYVQSGGYLFEAKPLASKARTFNKQRTKTTTSLRQVLFDSSRLLSTTFTRCSFQSTLAIHHQLYLDETHTLQPPPPNHLITPIKSIKMRYSAATMIAAAGSVYAQSAYVVTQIGKHLYK